MSLYDIVIVIIIIITLYYALLLPLPQIIMYIVYFDQNTMSECCRLIYHSELSATPLTSSIVGNIWSSANHGCHTQLKPFDWLNIILSNPNQY